MDKCKQNETFSKQNCYITDTADSTSGPAHVLRHSKNTINRLYDPVRYTKTSIHTLHSITMKQSVHFTEFLLGGELVGGESTSWWRLCWWRDDRLACEVSVRPGETSRDQTVSHLCGKETFVICACLQRISLLLCAEDQQSKKSPQERARGRIQIHRRFTLRSGSIGASSPLPRTTRHSHRLQIRNDTLVTFGAT